MFGTFIPERYRICNEGRIDFQVKPATIVHRRQLEEYISQRQIFVDSIPAERAGGYLGHNGIPYNSCGIAPEMCVQVVTQRLIAYFGFIFAGKDADNNETGDEYLIYAFHYLFTVGKILNSQLLFEESGSMAVFAGTHLFRCSAA